jgi:hypothetical protein
MHHLKGRVRAGPVSLSQVTRKGSGAGVEPGQRTTDGEIAEQGIVCCGILVDEWWTGAKAGDRARAVPRYGMAG